MNNFEFLVLLYNNLGAYIPCILLSCIIYWKLLKAQVNNIFDPLFLVFIGSTFSTAVIFFLYATKSIGFYYFSQYCITQAAFLFPFIKFSNITYKKSTFHIFIIKDEKQLMYCTILILTLLDVLLQLYVYKVTGIPLFKESRLETFYGGSGFGIIARIITITRFFSIYYSFYFLFDYKLHIRKYIITYLFLTIIFCVLSGSKSSILIYLHIFFCYCLVNKKKFPSISTKKVLTIGLGLCTIVIFSLYLKSNNLTTSIFSFLERFIFYGDIYWQAYSYDTIKSINFNGNIFTALFSDFLGSFRIMPWKHLPDSIGYTLSQYHNTSDLIMGANARHNVLGLIYCGYIGSIIFSFILGCTLSWARNILINTKQQSQIIKAFIVFLYTQISNIEIDPTLVVAGIDSMVITLLSIGFLIFSSYCIIKYINKNGNIYHNC